MRTRGIARLAASVGVAISLPVFAAQAQDAAEQAADGAATADEIIVTAQRRSESISRAPVAVSVITTEVLEKQAIVTEFDLQTAVPGLIVKASQNENQLNFSLRGQTVGSFSSSRPSVLPYFNEVQVGGEGATALYDLESVQVLKGPQGTLFGRNATGGALLYTSKRPEQELGGFITGRIGKYDARQLEGAINLPLGDSAAIRVAGFLQRRDGYQRNLFRDERLGEANRDGLRFSLSLTPSDGFSNLLVVDYGRSRGRPISPVVWTVSPVGAPALVPSSLFFSPGADSVFGPGAWDTYLAAHPGADPDGLIAFAEKQKARGPYTVDVDAVSFYRANKWVISNITTIDLSDEMQLKNIVGYVRSKARGGGELDGSPYGIDAIGPVGRGGTVEQLSDELQIFGTAFDKRLDYVAGIFLSHETDDARGQSLIFGYEPFVPTTNQINAGKFTNKTFAGYAQGTYTLTGNLRATIGGRYTIEKVRFERAADDTFVLAPQPIYDYNQKSTFRGLSWTLGLESQITPELLLYAKSRRSFRSGGFNFYGPPVPGFGNATGGGYRPETATDIELGVKYSGVIGDGTRVRFNLAAYNMWVEDVQRVFYATIAGTLAAITVNVPKARIRGIEIDGSIQPLSWLTFGGSLNYTDAKFTDNVVEVLNNPTAVFDTYPDTPKWSGVFYADAEIPVTDRLDFNLRGDIYAQTGNYFSSTGNSLTVGSRLPGYEVVGLRAGIQDETAGWSLAGIVRNVFDKTYYTGGIGFANLFALNIAVPGEPRTFLIEAKFRF
jgi:iron complex outermembrane receptor protein